jgi:hypothetical protein
VQGATMLRVAHVRSATALESVRDALDGLGVDYEHVRSEPGEDASLQTAYLSVPDGSADDVDAAMQRPSEEHDFDAEVL